MISTAQLEVRHLIEEDYEAARLLEGNSEVRKFTGAPLSVSREAFLKAVSKRSTACMAVCTKHDGRYIGRCGFRENGRRVELEIFLFPEKQGAGLGSELFDAMIEYCSVHFRGSVPAASVSPDNKHAVRLLVGRGFTATDERAELKTEIPHMIYIKKAKRHSQHR